MAHPAEPAARDDALADRLRGAVEACKKEFLAKRAPELPAVPAWEEKGQPKKAAGKPGKGGES